MKIEQILKKAFHITKTYPYLWLLSFLAIIGGVAQEGGASFNFNIPSSGISDSSAPAIGDAIESFFDNIVTYIPIILISIGILLLIWLVLFIIGLIAKSGQIDSILKHDQDKLANFSIAFSEGKKYAWRIFLVRLLYSIAVFISAILSIFVVIITLLVFFITIPALWIYYTALNVLLKNAEILIVKKNLGVIESIKQSWHLLASDWKNILILWLVQFGLGLAITFIFFFVGIIFFIFIVMIAVFISLAIQSIASSTILPIIIGIAIIIGLLIAVVILFVSSVLHTFYTSYWTIGINSIVKK